jgi:DNA-binding NtrC family response regulator
VTGNDEPRTITAGDDSREDRPPPIPCLHLALSSHRPLAPLLRVALAGLRELEIGRAAAPDVASPSAGKLVVKLADPRLSSRHARLSFVLGRWIVEDLGSKNGTAVNGSRISQATLADGDLVEAGHQHFLFREHAGARAVAPVLALDGASETPGLATTVPDLAEAYARLAPIARSQVAVRIAGETGTGKELAARAVHGLSGRAGPLVAVNCGAIAPGLVEGELFGHRKGAFSGALDDRPGLVRAADRGTLFLDEVAELPRAAQAALLRVLQEGEVVPIGGVAPIRVDLRVVSATHRSLEAMTEAGDFRADLYGRLSGYRIDLPPLRARREDLGLFVAALLRRLAPERAASFALEPRVARALLAHSWPGNVRELERVLGAAVALAADGTIAIDHLPERLRELALGGPGDPGGKPSPDPGEPRALADEVAALEQARMREALAATGGNQTRAAALLAMPLRTFQTKIKQYGLSGSGR